MAQLVQIPWKTWVCLSNKANTITANDGTVSSNPMEDMGLFVQQS